MKKIKGSVLTALLLAAMISGCGQSSDKSSSNSDPNKTVTPDYVVNIDYCYQNFEDRSRWSIIRTEIVRFNSDQYYSFWYEVGLTEMQENEWYDQKPEIAREKKIEKWIWTMEEIKNETNS